VGRVRCPIKSTTLKTLKTVNDKFRLILLRHSKIGMEARRDRHCLITMILNRQRVSEGLFVSTDGCSKGKLIWIARISLIVARELYADVGGILFNDCPRQVTSEPMNRQGSALLLEETVFEPREVGDHKW